MGRTGRLILGLAIFSLCGLGSFLSTAGAAPFAYIPNGGSNSVSVLDTATVPPLIKTTIPVGTNPRGVASAVKASETFTYVTNFGSENVSVLRTYSDPVTIPPTLAFEKVRDIRVGRQPYGIAVDAAGAFAYVTNYEDNTVSKIDLGANAVTATITVGSRPIGIAITPDGSKVYVVNNSSGTVSVINAATNSVTATVTVGSNPFAAAVDPAGASVYVTNSGVNSLSIIKTADDSVTTKQDFRLGTPMGVAVNPAGTLVYITNYGTGTLTVFDAVGNAFSSPNIAVAPNPIGVSASLDGALTFVISNTDGTVSVIDNGTNTERLPRVQVGALPYALGAFVARFGTTVPTVASTKPAGGATDVTLGTEIQVTFSDFMDAATITGATFFVSGGVTGVVTYDNATKTARFKPASTLEKNTTYTVTLTKDIRNTLGIALASTYTWSFTTSEKSGSGCFIATAVYGSPEEAEVRILRRFRDDRLLPYGWGRALVSGYYACSPPLAAFITRHEVLRTPLRWLLAPVVHFVQYPSHLALIIGLGLIVLTGRIAVRRKVRR